MADPSMAVGVLLLYGEVVVLSAVAVGLHAWRKRVGIQPLLLFAGGLLVALNVLTPLGVTWVLTPDILVPVVSVTLFPVVVCLIALVYTLEGPGNARSFLTGILVVQFVFTLVVFAFATQASLFGATRGPTFLATFVHPRIYFAGLAALAIDLIGLVALYQFLLNRLPRLPVPVALSFALATVLVLDGFVYPILAEFGTPTFGQHLVAHLLLKPLAGALAGALLGVYVDRHLARYPGEVRGRLLHRPTWSLLWSEDALDRAQRQIAEAARILEEMRAQFAGILAGVPGSIYVATPDGTLLFANNDLGRAVGRAPEQLVGRPAEDVLGVVAPEAGRQALVEGVHRFRGPAPGADARYHCLAVRRTGRLGDAVYVVGTLQDVTEEVVVEELQKATARQREALTRMRELNQELEDFTYTVTHDLSEPLRSIETLLGYLEEDVGGKLGPEDAELLKRVQEAAKRLRESLAALLVLSRMTRAEVPREPVDTAAVVRQAAETVAPDVAGARAAVQVQGPLPTVPAAPARIESIFMNLIGNALKYAGGADAQVVVSALDRGNEWEFSVADNGPGVPVEERDRIFQIFRRGPGASAVPGAGAGLAIVRRLVRGEGGEIWVTDSPLGGADFRFTLPKEPDVGGLGGGGGAMPT